MRKRTDKNNVKKSFIQSNLKINYTNVHKREKIIQCKGEKKF